LRLGIAPQPAWSVHRNADVLQRSVDTVDGAFTGETSRVWIVIMTQIACGLMTANGAILPEERLAPLLRNSPDLPDGADGLSPDMYVFLSEMRDGARMHRDWPKREYRHTTPTNSQYRVANPEVFLEWKLKARWKTVTFDLRQRQGVLCC
jgi:hypothetical protein